MNEPLRKDSLPKNPRSSLVGEVLGPVVGRRTLRVDGDS